MYLRELAGWVLWYQIAETNKVSPSQLLSVRGKTSILSQHIDLPMSTGVGRIHVAKQPSKNLEERDTTSSPVADFRNPREKDLRPILDRVGFALASLPRHELTKPREL